ncbi:MULTISPECIES: LacI family DNA-binding transcriptional regulator [Bacillus]|uniref:LacI family DNA-binding transcriptional regulator n=1 Tax=Bacillus TaxID=1386 RepID=UPI001581F786|nr:LacI family DNA-binding transcriptional regulator [Bacillus glycinifermentans]MBU8787408.1 substrate-binding domain-containing protein [Bacillus glycinifermentans]NUJ17039.1 LacI family transcriptional regulator [Bacillus glycinifermentans]
MKITIYDVAEAAGVSISTVSRVINNTGRISQSTRQKVFEVMKDLDYQPNVHASALTGKRTNIIGLLTPDISNPFFGELAKSVEERADELGFSIIMCSTDRDRKKETKYFSVLRQKNVDGIIFATGIENKESLAAVEDIADEGIPLVMISQDRALFPMDVVVIDDLMAGYIAAKHLISLGHKSIACVIGDGTTTCEKDRLKGFKKAMDEAGIAAGELLTAGNGFSLQGGKKAASSIFSQKVPTAVLAINDVLACAVIQTAKEWGLEVPGDVSVIGFDNTMLAEMVAPPLTTVSQPIEEMGRRVVELLAEEIRGAKKSKSKTILAPELIIRQSTARPRTTEKTPEKGSFN